MTHESDELADGYTRFRETTWPAQRARYEALAREGQTPHTLIVACSDSRADPSVIFDAAPGELFVVRNVANIVPKYHPDGAQHGVSAALEFGVKVLKVRRIVVMGHAQCGGVGAMLTQAPDACPDFVGPWVAPAEHVVRAVAAHTPSDQVVQAAEEAVVRFSLTNLRTFPWIAEREAAGDLVLQGLHFGIGDGVLRRLEPGGDFEPVSPH